MRDGLPPLRGATQHVFDALVDFVRVHRYPPSVRQLGDACGLSSPSTVHAHLARLMAAGYIVRENSSSRPGIRIVGFDTDADVVRDLARADPVYKTDPCDPVSVALCCLCGGVGGVKSVAIDLHHETCPWLRARKLYAE